MVFVDLDEMNLSLAGCGYLGSYHLGVCACMRQFVPQVFRNKTSGASVGALIAASFVCNVPFEKVTNTVFDVSMKVRCGVLGPMSPDLNIMKLLYDNMKAILPEDAHLYCNGRLFISVTRYDDCKNVLLSQFDSKEDVLQALMCSCFIPLYCGYEPPEFHGVAYVDGGYSDNSPRLDEHTVIVAPFYGDSEICPNDPAGVFRNFMMNNTSIYITLKNCRRLLRILFPGPPEMLKDLCQKGFNDALRFLRDNGMIQCSDCSFSRMEINGNIPNENMDHKKCRLIEYPLPMEICNQIEKTVQDLNGGIGNRLLKNPVVKVLYYLNMPSIFTVKLSYSLFSAIAKKLHNKASSCVVDVSRDLLHYFREIIQHPKFQSSIHYRNGFDDFDQYFDETIEEVKIDTEVIDGVQNIRDSDVALDLDIGLPDSVNFKLQKSSLYPEKKNNHFLKKSNPETQSNNSTTREISKHHTNSKMSLPDNGQIILDILNNSLCMKLQVEQEQENQHRNGTVSV